MLQARVRDLLAAAGGDPDATARPLAGGDVCEVVCCGDLVVKHLADAPAGLFAAEAAGLRRLGAAGARVPEVRYVARDGLVLAYLPPGRSDPAALGRALAALHAPVEAAYGSDRTVFLGRLELPAGTSDDWTACVRDLRLRPLLDQTRTLLGAALHDRLSRWLDGARFPVEGPCLVHGDLWSGNVLHTVDGPALIDPSVQVAERGLDLAMMRLFGGFSPSVWRAMTEARPIPASVERALDGYALYYLLAHVALFGDTWVGRVGATLQRIEAGVVTTRRSW